MLFILKTVFSIFLIIFTPVSSNKTTNFNTKITDDNCTITSFDQVSSVVSSQCYHIIISNLTVPAGQTLNLTLNVQANVFFDGIITFEKSDAAWEGPLVLVSGGLVIITGNPGSVLDGQGQLYWNSENNIKKPTFFHVACSTSTLQNINLLNCPGKCVEIENSTLVEFQGWNIDTSAADIGVAPTDIKALNTIGFQISNSFLVIIVNTTVKNQDHCIVIENGHNMLFRDIFCSGGKGFAVDMGNTIENTLADVLFVNSTLTNSSNAIRVLTHSDSGSGEVLNVSFQNITFSGILEYAILVEQDLENGYPTGNPSENIHITNLTVVNVTGTITGDSAGPVYILCGADSCTDWRFSGVNITEDGVSSKPSFCNYVPFGYDC